MAQYYRDTVIKTMRGDNFNLDVFINNLPFELSEGCKTTFTIRRWADGRLVKKKEIDTPKLGAYKISLTPTETEDLSGSYVFDIEVRDANLDNRRTVLDGEFLVGKDVTYNE